MEQKLWGFRAIDVRGFVANEPRVLGGVTFLPVSVGFKQRDGTWLNTFLDLKCFKELADKAAGMSKKDRLTFSGRMEYSEWQDKQGNKRPQWAVLVDELKCESSGYQQQPPQQTRDVRQAPAVMDEAPF